MMSGLLRRLRHAETGVATTTLAMLAPVLLFIIFATSEGSRIMFTWMVLTNEAAEAARAGAVRYDEAVDPVTQEAQIKTFITQRLDGVLDPTGMVPAPVVKVTTTNPPTVSVTLSYQVDLIIPMVSALLPDPFPLKVRSVMAAESSES
jgi:Flp pilus assembly protein TadG